MSQIVRYAKKVHTAVAQKLANILNADNAKYGMFEFVAKMGNSKTVTADALQQWAVCLIISLLEDPSYPSAYTIVDAVAIRDHAEEIVQYLQQ